MRSCLQIIQNTTAFFLCSNRTCNARIVIVATPLVICPPPPSSFVLLLVLLLLVLLHFLEELLLPLPSLLLPLLPFPDGIYIHRIGLLVCHEVRCRFLRRRLEGDGKTAPGREQVRFAVGTVGIAANSLGDCFANAETNFARIITTTSTATGSTAAAQSASRLATSNLLELIVIITCISTGMAHTHLHLALLPQIVTGHTIIPHIGILQDISTPSVSTAIAEEGRVGQGQYGLAGLKRVGRVSDGHTLQVLRSVFSTLLAISRHADAIDVGSTAFAALFGPFLLLLLLFLGGLIVVVVVVATARRTLLLLIILAGPHFGSPAGSTVSITFCVATSPFTPAKTKTSLGRQPADASLGLALGLGILHALPGGLLLPKIGSRRMDGLGRLAAADTACRSA